MTDEDENPVASDFYITNEINKIDPVNRTEIQKKKSWISSLLTSPFSSRIGKGDEAKDSVVWYVVTRVFRLAALVLTVLFAIDIYYNQGKNCMAILKDAWNVFVPIITLAMGYLFGKESKKDSEPIE